MSSKKRIGFSSMPLHRPTSTFTICPRQAINLKACWRTGS